MKLIIYLVKHMNLQIACADNYYCWVRTKQQCQSNIEFKGDKQTHLTPSSAAGQQHW